MATYTDNYRLSKPETTDSQQSFIEDYATNMDIIDENMGGGSGGGGHVIIDENDTEVAQEPNMQFTGKVEVTDDSTNEKTVVEVLPEVVEVTLAEYIALGDVVNTDGKLYCITDLNNSDVQGYPPLIYSDVEREVGVWRDGKPLYQKTYSVDNVGSSSVLVDSSMNLTNIDLVGFINNGLKMNSPYSGEVFQLGLATSAILRIWNSSSGLYCNIEGAGSGITGTCRFTVQYTKTTDTAGSGIWNGQGGYAHHYSTSEKVIGTWIDGKPLYEKTWDFGSNVEIPTGSWTSVPIVVADWNIKNVIDATATNNGGTMFNVLGINTDQTNIQLLHSRSGGGPISIRYLTLQYTKTTD